MQNLQSSKKKKKKKTEVGHVDSENKPSWADPNLIAMWFKHKRQRDQTEVIEKEGNPREIID